MSTVFIISLMNVKKSMWGGVGRHSEMIIHAFETQRHAVACLMPET